MCARRTRPVTRADVAREAGVSTAVVSYVVNNDPQHVSEATRVRVRDAIRRLGYRPNASARALKIGQTGLIGLVVPEVLNPYYAEFVEALDRAAAERGSSILLGLTHKDPEGEEKTVRSLVARGVDSLIYQCDFNDEKVYRVGGDSMPRVLLDRSEPLPGLVTVGADSTDGARQVVEHLVGHGHRRIGYVGGRMVGRKSDLRLAAWRQVMAEHHLDAPAPVLTDWSRKGGYRSVGDLMDRDDAPSAIFAGSDFTAVGVLQALHDRGLQVPRDVAVASFDGTADSAYAFPALTTVRQPFDEMAGRAVDLLGEDGLAPRSTVFPMTLVVRSSCGC